MQVLTALLGAALFFTVSYLAWNHAMKMNRFGVTSAAMGLPMMWAYLPIAIFSFTLSLRFLIVAARQARGFLRNEPLKRLRKEEPAAGEAAS